MRLLIFLNLIYLLVICISFEALSQEKHADDLNTELTAVLNAQQFAWNNGNIGGYMEGYWKSDSLLFTSAGKSQRGWQATFEKYKKSYDTKEKMGQLTFSDLEFYALSTDAAWVFGRWALERSGDHPSGLFTLIYRKFSDGWKIVHDHTSSFPPDKK
jgi:ketosteroid isomerase-like protein